MRRPQITTPAGNQDFTTEISLSTEICPFRPRAEGQIGTLTDLTITKNKSALSGGGGAMKTEIKIRSRFILSTVVLFVTAISLWLITCSVRASMTDMDVADPGETINVGTGAGMDWDSLLYLTIKDGGEANLYIGGVIEYVSAWPGSTLNIKGGDVANWIYATSNTEKQPEITVYGTNFAVNGAICDPPPTTFTIVPGGVELTGNYGEVAYSLSFFGSTGIKVKLAVPGDLEVAIDIKPGSDTNIINLKSKGVVPVAILTTGSFDAHEVDAGTVEFADAMPVQWAFEDVDGDGDEDMIIHFKTQDLNLVSTQELNTLSAQASDAEASAVKKAMLTGRTTNNYRLSGSDTVRITAGKE